MPASDKIVERNFAQKRRNLLLFLFLFDYFCFSAEISDIEHVLKGIDSTSHFMHNFTGSVIRGMKMNWLSYAFLLSFTSSFTHLFLFSIFLLNQLPAQR